MDSDFEATFAKIARKNARKKKRSNRSAKPVMNLGDTEAGRQIATGTVREDPEEQEVRKAQTWNIREIPAYRGHASKGRGHHGGVRKFGIEWRTSSKRTKT